MRKYFKNLKGNSLKAQVLRGASGTAGIQAVNLLLMLASGVLLARSLGPENYGTYSFVLSIITLLSLPTKAGLPTLLVRETAKHQLNMNWGVMRGLFKASNLFAAGYSIFVVVVVIIWLISSGVEYTDQDTVMLWALWLLPLMAFGDVRVGILRGLRWVVSGQAPEQIIRPLTLIIFVGSFVLFGKELTAVTAIQFNIIGAALAFAVGAFFLFKALPRDVRTVKPEYSYKQWGASLLPLILFSGLKLLDSQISILFLGFLATNEEVGLFRVAATGAALVVFGLNAVNLVIAPHISRLYNAGEIKKLQKVVTISTRAVAALSFPIALIFIFFGKPIIGFIFGAEYVSAAPALAILCLGQLVNASAGPIALVLIMTGNDKYIVIGTATGLVVNLFLSFLLIPLLGLIGAAIGFSVSLSVWNVLLILISKNKVGINTLFFAKK